MLEQTFVLGLPHHVQKCVFPIRTPENTVRHLVNQFQNVFGNGIERRCYTYMVWYFLLSALTKYTSWTEGTLIMRPSSLTSVPPKNTGKAWASHVTGLNINGNVKFMAPLSTWKVQKRVLKTLQIEEQQHISLIVFSTLSPLQGQESLAVCCLTFGAETICKGQHHFLADVVYSSYITHQLTC